MKNTKIMTALALLAFVPFAALAETPAVAPANEIVKPEVKKTSTPAGWTDDFEAAKKQAASEGKDLLVAFSGSDWCGWCIRLEKEVFSTDGFAEKVSEIFVPVYIDNPSDTTRLSALAKKQNGPLTDSYRIKGFPTVLLMDAEGDVFAETGYSEGGPEKYIEKLKKLVEEGKLSPEYRAQKELSAIPQGPQRAKQLDAVLSTLPVNAQLANKDYIDEVLAADPDGKLGYRAKYPYFTIVLPLEEDFNAVVSGLSKEADRVLKEHGKPKSQEEYVKIVSGVLKKNAAKLSEIREKAEAAKQLFPKKSQAEQQLNDVVQYVDYMFLNFIDKKAVTPNPEQ